MTEITPEFGVDQAGCAIVETDQQAIPRQRHDDPLIRIELVGCPNVVPRMMVARSCLEEGRLKLPYGNGYDHFIFDSYITRNGKLVPVFTWIDHTKVAE